MLKNCGHLMYISHVSAGTILDHKINQLNDLYVFWKNI